MANEDGIFDGFHTAWDYCEDRIAKSSEKARKKDSTYFYIYKAFVSWFDSKFAHFPIVDDDGFENPHPLDMYRNTDGGLVFITQKNVELYFSTHIVLTAVGTAANNKRKMSGLNWYLQQVEDRTAEPQAEILYSTKIDRAIEDSYIVHVSHSNTKFASVDPHKGIKDLYSEEEAIALVDGIWSLSRDSLDLMFSYTWGRNAGVRGASSRKVTLCDLNLSYGFGPEEAAPRNRTLMMILRRGDMHKDRYTTDQQVGVYRHKDYRRCTVFATAALVIMKLRKLDKVDCSFKNKKPRPNWWDLSLNQYEHYNTESSSMRQALHAVDLYDKHTKVTHHRSMAVQYGGSRGLTPSQISTFTKHQQDKLNKSYMPDVEEETLKVMCGFKKHECRFVPTEHVVFPVSHEQYMKTCTAILLPQYSRFVEEYEASTGDKTRAATTVLLHVLPYLMETLLQCGYWFIRDYPHHELSHLLKVSALASLIQRVLLNSY